MTKVCPSLQSKADTQSNFGILGFAVHLDLKETDK